MKAYSLSPTELLVVDDMKSGFDMAKLGTSLRLGWMGTSGDTGNFRFYETVLRLFLCNPDRIGAIFILKGMSDSLTAMV